MSRTALEKSRNDFAREVHLAMGSDFGLRRRMTAKDSEGLRHVMPLLGDEPIGEVIDRISRDGGTSNVVLRVDDEYVVVTVHVQEVES